MLHATAVAYPVSHAVSRSSYVEVVLSVDHPTLKINADSTVTSDICISYYFVVFRLRQRVTVTSLATHGGWATSVISCNTAPYRREL